MLTADKIIVYGAGEVGLYVLKCLKLHGICKDKIFVWDINHRNISDRYGYSVVEPDFSPINDDGNILVLLAFRDSTNAVTVSEMTNKFKCAGYKKIFPATEILWNVKKVEAKNFYNNAYFDSAYQEDISFDGRTAHVKPIAFYLPQFHEIPENNEWWGKGFTEWTNTKKAKPNFKGHYQPRHPHNDLGYYDLSDVEAIRKQAKLARNHGIYGWCIYYYWFSGRKLLTKPIDLLFENKDIDINFCLFWCNETWTKKWVGEHETILIDNKYTETDPEAFIDDLKKYMTDSRYIRLEGKPIIVVQHIKNIPDINETVLRWKKRAIEIGIGDISVIFATNPMQSSDYGLTEPYLNDVDSFSILYRASNAIRLVDEYGATVTKVLRYYADYVESYINHIENSDHKSYWSCCVGFDNTPRFAENSNVYDIGFSLRTFYKLVKYIVEEAHANKKEYMFVFAWNEWAESAYLEPDKKFGYAVINTFSKALYGIPLV